MNNHIGEGDESDDGVGDSGPFRPLRITPVEHDGEETDLSINHDKYLADWTLDGALPDRVRPTGPLPDVG